jgi:hypothetical protein
MSDMTTTPISEPITAPEIEATFGDGELTDAGRGPAVSIIDEWRRFGAFLKRPTLDVCSQDRGAFTVIARIYALDIAAMAVLVGLASALVAMGVYIPETALAGMEFTLPIILMVVIGAPVMEELAFVAGFQVSRGQSWPCFCWEPVGPLSLSSTPPVLLVEHLLALPAWPQQVWRCSFFGGVQPWGGLRKSSPSSFSSPPWPLRWSIWPTLTKARSQSCYR